MIKIDFHGSMHGHFLEYVVNVYIMKTTPSKVSIFKPPTYSAHAPDESYLNNRIVRCGHYSKTHTAFTSDDQVIRITLDTTDDDMFFIALSNLVYKAGDVGFEKQMLASPKDVRNDPVAHRNQWYSKFNEREKFANHYNEFTSISNPVFDFPFKSFFSFTDFCVALSSMSKFLDQTFIPDQTLYELWSTFIRVNQGWQSYTKCNQILEDIFSNRQRNIDCTIIEQGWLNFKLYKICQIFDGPFFDDESYVTNTQDAYKILQTQLKSMR